MHLRLSLFTAAALAFGACSSGESSKDNASTSANPSSNQIISIAERLFDYDEDEGKSYFSETLVFVDGKSVNESGPNAGGCSESRFTLSGDVKSSDSYKNFAAALLASDCPFRNGNFSTLSYSNSEAEKIDSIRCLGAITTSSTECGEE